MPEVPKELAGKNMKRLLLTALAASIVLTPAALPGVHGRAHAPAYVPPLPRVLDAEVGSYDKIHNVAVLSGIGVRFDLQYENHYAPKTGSLNVAAWRLDDKATAVLRRSLRGRFAFVDVPYDRALLASLRPTAPHAAEFENFLKSVPNQNVDAFIVLRPDSQSGMQLQSIHHGETVLWVRYEMDVIDAHSLKLIAKSTSRLQLKKGAPPNLPGMILGDEFKLDDTLAVSSANQEKLRLMTLETLYVSLLETMRSLKLPLPGDNTAALSEK
jgi:hypothetical protein